MEDGVREESHNPLSRFTNLKWQTIAMIIGIIIVIIALIVIVVVVVSDSDSTISSPSPSPSPSPPSPTPSSLSPSPLSPTPTPSLSPPVPAPFFSPTPPPTPLSHDVCLGNEVGYAPYYESTSFTKTSHSLWLEKEREPLSPFALVNATLWDGTGKIIEGANIIINQKGKIEAIGTNLPIPVDIIHHDLFGKVVTPGLVDLHSHMGGYFWPLSQRSNGINEMTNPTLPNVRVIDSIQWDDPQNEFIRAGGVTTSLILPGSGNVMGGEAFVFKHREGVTSRDMVINDARRTLKMACGENPSAVYNGKGVIPSTRMGVGWLFRDQFMKAAEIIQKQNEWDCKSVEERGEIPRPYDLALEPLVGVLRGEVFVHIHCYAAGDIEMLLRTSQEFNFSITAVHHGLEAWKIGPLLKHYGVAAAIFGDSGLFKEEAYHSSVKTAEKLRQDGVPVILKSDHPVLSGADLAYIASRTAYYGFDVQAALRSITLEPAIALGLSHRIGTVEVGKDADIVVWKRPWHQVGARPSNVFVEGKELFTDDEKNFPSSSVARNIKKEKREQKKKRDVAEQQEEDTFTLPTGTTEFETSECTTENIDCYYIHAGGLLTMENYVVGEENSYQNSVLLNRYIVVQGGIIDCIGQAGQCTVPDGCLHYSVPLVVPGFVDIGTQGCSRTKSEKIAGLVEVPSTSDSSDGSLSSTSTDLTDIQAADGIRFNVYENRRMSAAFAGGITVFVTPPLGDGVLVGYSAAFYTRGQIWSENGKGTPIPTNQVFSKAVIKEKVALHGTIGNSAKNGGASNSITGQFSLLREKVKFSEDDLMIRVDSVDYIDTLLRLLKDDKISPRSLKIVGAQEAYLLADELAEAGVGVVVSGFEMPSGYDRWNARDDNLALLVKAGVKVAYSHRPFDSELMRNARWDAGIQHYRFGLGWLDSLATITINSARLSKLESDGVGNILIGTPANFLGFSDDPLSYDGNLLLIAMKDTVTCNPVQF